MTDVERIQRTFVKALGADDGFERHGLRRGTWDVSRDCERPVPVTMTSRATGLARNISRKGVKGPPMIELNMLTPCRKCPTCLRKRAALWRGRAITEIEASERTWFGTLTCSPERHFWLDTLCASKVGNFGQLPWEEKFKHQSAALGIEVTKYLKRVREASGCPFRYLLVTEIHNGERTSEEMKGRPHLHMLLHEFPGSPLRKATLEKQWKLGFTSWRLTKDKEAAWYVSKYISKANDARTRASLGYGKL